MSLAPTAICVARPGSCTQPGIACPRRAKKKLAANTPADICLILFTVLPPCKRQVSYLRNSAKQPKPLATEASCSFKPTTHSPGKPANTYSGNEVIFGEVLDFRSTGLHFAANDSPRAEVRNQSRLCQSSMLPSSMGLACTPIVEGRILVGRVR